MQDKVKYRFLLSVCSSHNDPLSCTIPVEVTPHYSELSINYEKDADNVFFRKKLNSTLKFVGDDYNKIYYTDFDSFFRLKIQWREGNIAWDDVINLSFSRTDCTINEDDYVIEVQPNTEDQYTDVVNGLDKEIDIAEFTTPLHGVNKIIYPLTQIYAGQEHYVDEINKYTNERHHVSVADVIDTAYTSSPFNTDAVMGNGGFVITQMYVRIRLTGWHTPVVGTHPLELTDLGLSTVKCNEAMGIYSGLLTYQSNGYLVGNLQKEGGDVNHYIRVEFKNSVEHVGIDNFLAKPLDIYIAIGATYYRLCYTNEFAVSLPYLEPLSTDFTWSIADGNTRGLDLGVIYRDNLDWYNVPIWYASYYIVPFWQRVLNNVQGTTPVGTMLVDNNFGYSRQFANDDQFITISLNRSQDDTGWGVIGNTGYYYDVPSEPPAGFEWLPIGRERWDYLTGTSFWMLNDIPYTTDLQSMQEFDSEARIYELHNILSEFLTRFSDVTFSNTPLYSQFFYNGTNPISGDNFKLAITAVEEVHQNRTRDRSFPMKLTLKTLLDLLKSVFQCYWFIDDNKRLHLEHINYFYNGGSYSGTPFIGIDLTMLSNNRLGKRLSYCKNTYKFDKIELPEQIEFGWGVENDYFFNGQPMRINSNFVQIGKVERKIIDRFAVWVDNIITSSEYRFDDLVLLAINKDDNSISTVVYENEIMQNGLLSFTDLLPKYWLYNAPAQLLEVNGEPTLALSVKRSKRQSDIKIPTYPNGLVTDQLIRTDLGNGKIDKASQNLITKMYNIELIYDNE